MKILLAVGAGVAVLGLIAFFVGYPISDTSFGNAMMIDGVTVLCTGLLMTAMSVIGRQLERIAALLGDGRPAQVAPQPVAPQIEPLGAEASLFPVAETAAPATPPWQSENGGRSLATPVAPQPVEEPVAPSPPPAPERPARRNLLFETSRKRETPPPAAPVEATIEQPAPPPPAPKSPFDNAWSGEPRAPAPAPAAPAAPAAPTIIKSGIVDGMMYSLYSDGSIEAQMPAEGLIRFASLDELRDYLEHRH